MTKVANPPPPPPPARTVMDWWVLTGRWEWRAGWRVAAQIHDAALDVPTVKRTGKTTSKVARRPTLKQVARWNRLAVVGIKP